MALARATDSTSVDGMIFRTSCNQAARRQVVGGCADPIAVGPSFPTAVVLSAETAAEAFRDDLSPDWTWFPTDGG